MMNNRDCIRFYHGHSMAGTFQPGDCLKIVSTTIELVVPGDVIVFEKKGREDEIVHRVIALQDGSMVTRGDNNRQVDLEPVTRLTLIGKVASYERDGETRLVNGGQLGLLQVGFQRLSRRGSRFFRRIVGVPYRWLRRSRLVKLIWKPKFTQIRLETPNGKVVKYIYRRRTVAVWRAHNNSFEIRKPYDLVLHRTKPPDSDLH